MKTAREEELEQEVIVLKETIGELEREVITMIVEDVIDRNTIK